MKRTLLILVCLALLSGAAYAQGTAKPLWWHKPPAPVNKPVVPGTVTNVGPTAIEIQTPAGVKSFVVTPKTKVMIRGAKATIADIKVGDVVRVSARIAKGVTYAAKVAIPKPPIKGRISAIAEKSFTLKTKTGDLTISVTDATKFTSHGYQGAFADLRVNYGANIEGTAVDKTVTADRVEFVPATAKGAVTAVDGNNITVKTVSKKTIKSVASDKTVVIIKPRVGPNKRGTLADVKVGLPVNIGFAPDKSGTSPLLWIEVLTGV